MRVVYNTLATWAARTCVQVPSCFVLPLLLPPCLPASLQQHVHSLAYQLPHLPAAAPCLLCPVGAALGGYCHKHWKCSSFAVPDPINHFDAFASIKSLPPSPSVCLSPAILLLWGDPLLRPLSLPLPFANSQRDRKFVLASLDDDDVSVTSTPEYSPPTPVAVAALGQVLCKCWHDLGPLLVSLFWHLL